MESLLLQQEHPEPPFDLETCYAILSVPYGKRRSRRAQSGLKKRECAGGGERRRRVSGEEEEDDEEEAEMHMSSLPHQRRITKTKKIQQPHGERMRRRGTGGFIQRPFFFNFFFSLQNLHVIYTLLS